VARFRSASAVLAAVALVVVVVTAPSWAGPSRAVKPAAPASGALFGVWDQPQGDGDRAGIQRQWSALVDDLGRAPDIAHTFYSFSDPFPSWLEPWYARHGSVPMMSWAGTTSAEVVAGRHDAMIRKRARAVKELGEPMFLRYFAEPEAAKHLARSGSPETYKADWRRVHRLFDEEGATNVAWVWCPTAWGFQDGRAPTYYPGDDVVDWVCADGYNWGAQKRAPWRDFATIFDAFYAFGVAAGKPLMIGEYGTVEGGPGQKSEWFATAREQIKRMPAVKAVVYFNSNRFEDGHLWRWRVTSSPSARTGFERMARDPYFHQRRESSITRF
jgi:hypothetical protein